MADSITSLVAQPILRSMAVTVRVSRGTNQLRQALGTYSMNYGSSQSVAEVYTELAAGATYTGAPTRGLFVSTSGAVNFAGTVDGVTDPVECQIKRMFFLDTAFTTFTLTNAGTTPVRINIIYSSPDPALVEDEG